jgi:23S rRNA (uracil1939-C5)-methyltransferase
LRVSETIVRLAARGDGVTDSGRFVALTAPGDAIAEDGSIARGPHHAEPPCPHFPQCGGCQLQHIDDHAYADFVRDRIAGALAAQGLDAPVFKPVHLSPPSTRRRASLRAMRIGKRIVLGFNEAGSNRIVDVRACPVLHPALAALLDPARTMLGLLIQERKSATITMTLADQGVDLSIGGAMVDGLAATEAVTRFAADNRLARLSVDEGYGAEARWEPAPVTVTLGGVPSRSPKARFCRQRLMAKQRWSKRSATPWTAPRGLRTCSPGLVHLRWRSTGRCWRWRVRATRSWRCRRPLRAPSDQ